MVMKDQYETVEGEKKHLENHGKPLCGHHSMESSNKDSLLGIEPRRRALHIVGVGDHPWDDLNLWQEGKLEEV